MTTWRLPWAAIDWETPATPRSRSHGDIYWSRDQALAEKRHVFIEGNDLPARFARCDGCHFTTGEIGFGFGINFLLTVDAWRRAGPSGQLTCFAFEKAPVAPADLERCFAATGIDGAAAQALLAKYPAPVPGWHTILLADDVTLVLALGDAGAMIEELAGPVDAWYLDGFGPRMNADAWREVLFARMAARARPGATLTTYSVAGAIRRGLADAGFEVRKTAGHGTKAEMLSGQRPGRWMPAALHRPRTAVIGAGLGGRWCARALARKGCEVTVFDAGERASDAPGLAVYPQLSVAPDARNFRSMAAFEFARHHSHAFFPSGRCHLAADDDSARRLEQLAAVFTGFAQWLSASDVSDVCGLPSKHPGLWTGAAGWTTAAQEFAADPLDVHHGEVTSIEDRIVTLGDRKLPFDAVVLAAGHREFPQTGPLGRVPVRGQSVIGRLKHHELRAITGGPVSLLPAGDGKLAVGASYRPGVTDTTTDGDETRALLAALDRCFDVEFEMVSAWAGIRSTTRDRQPIAGLLPDWQALADYCESREPGGFDAWMPGLYILTGLGSHGATWAPLLAQHVARLVTGEVPCLSLSDAGHHGAARFMLRDHGRRREVAETAVSRGLLPERS